MHHCRYTFLLHLASRHAHVDGGYLVNAALVVAAVVDALRASVPLHFEVFGEGKDKIGGVWAAVRIPDDHVGVSANISRISTLNLKDPDHYMACLLYTSRCV